MAEKPLSILIIDEDEIRASIIKDGLTEAGLTKVSIILEIDSVMRRVSELDPDVIFIDLENPNRDMLEHMLTVSRTVQRPVAMFVERSDEGLTRAAIEAGVSAYIVDGLKSDRVKPILDAAVTRFNMFHRMRAELETTKRALEERKVIDRAKGLIMKAKGLGEDEAYALLRKAAMDQNKRVADVAQALVNSAGLLS